MIEFLLIFIGLLIYFSLKKLIVFLDQQAYEKRRFYLMVQAELDNMDKVSRDFIENRIKEDLGKWAGRN